MIATKNKYLIKSAFSAEDILQPILCDERYFLTRNSKVPAVEFNAYIKQGMLDIEAKLIPVATERLQQIVSRLLHHFSSLTSPLYLHLLSEYPEDLLCASYHYFLSHHKSKAVPDVYDLIAFMEPEMNRRKTVRNKLAHLSLHLNQEEMV